MLDLNAKPVAWALSGTVLLVALQPEELHRPCAEAPKSSEVIYAVQRDGSTSLVSNEASSCLFRRAAPTAPPSTP